MRSVIAALVATSLIASSAFAETQSVAPLSAGKPAGAGEAALLGPNSFLIFLGAGIFIGGLTMALSNNSHGVTTATNGTTSTSSLP